MQKVKPQKYRTANEKTAHTNVNINSKRRFQVLARKVQQLCELYVWQIRVVVPHKHSLYERERRCNACAHDRHYNQFRI